MKPLSRNTLTAAVLALCSCTESPVPTKTENRLPMETDYISMIQETADPAMLSSMPMMKWESRCTCEIIFANKKYASFRIESWSYTGGAHGMTIVKTGTVRNGKVLQIADLPDNVEKLWQKAVAEHFHAESFEQYIASEPTFMPAITENFYLTPDGIHFIYSPYEIDCFAAGTTEIFVPYSIE